jgi:hypothetical protein
MRQGPRRWVARSPVYYSNPGTLQRRCCEGTKPADSRARWSESESPPTSRRGSDAYQRPAPLSARPPPESQKLYAMRTTSFLWSGDSPTNPDKVGWHFVPRIQPTMSK